MTYVVPAMLGGRRVIVVIWLAACAHGGDGGFGKAMREGRAARQAGDPATAAHRFREACRIRPADQQACRLADESAQAAAGQALVAARKACAAGDPDVCLRKLAPARELYPGDAVATAIADEAGQLIAARCTGDAGDDDAADGATLALVRCLQAQQRAVSTPTFDARARAAAEIAADRFARLAASDAAAKTPGAAFPLWSAAACLDPQPEYARAAAYAKGSLVRDTALPARVDVAMQDRGPIPAALASLCAGATSELSGAARCEAAAALRVDVTLDLDAAEHEVSETYREVVYQSGVDLVDNPAYQAAQDRARDAERAFREIELDTADRRDRCQEAEAALSRASYCYNCPERDAEERECRHYKSIQEAHDRRYEDLTAARARLQGTPELVQNPRYETHHYVERNHRWEAPFRARVVSSREPGIDHGESGVLVYTDVERPGFAPAGVSDDPRQSPAPGHFEHALARRAQARVVTVLAGALDASARDRAAACDGAPAWNATWLACWSESTFLARQTLDPVALLGVACTSR